MSEIIENPFPLKIVPKVNSADLESLLVRYGKDKLLSAQDINEITKALTFLNVKSEFIKSNESLLNAKRKGDVLYGIIDRYTGEEISLTKTSDDDPADGIIYFTLSGEKFKRVFDQINVKWFGAKGDGINNDTNAIKKAIEASQKNYGHVFIPKGLYLTDYIDLVGFNNVTIEGSGYFSEFQYFPTTILKIRSLCDFGIKLASNEEVPLTLATGVVIKNLFLDSNNLADVGVNPCRSVKLVNFKTSNAKTDGISLTGGTYPVFLEHVVSQGNARDGLRVNAPNTTIYSVKDSEFGFNGGNGVTIFDGSSAIFENVLCQVNNGNGFYIYKKDPSEFETPIFLERISFINCYSEANIGWGIDINSYNTNPALYLGKILDLTFLNCSFNSGVGKHVRVKGTANVNLIGTPYFSDALGFTDNALDVSVFPVNGISVLRSFLDFRYSNKPGILFPAVQIPSVDPNFLDDYKEGAFTFGITQGSGINFTPAGVNFAKFTKIGNTVFCNIRHQWSDKGSASDEFFAYLFGLPYIANGSQSFDFDILTTAGDSNKFSAELINGDTAAQVRLNNKIAFSTLADFPPAGILTANFSYKTT